MSSGFITEGEIEERRRVRQEEWEKVRKPDEPLEVPEEDYDNRTLFERLEEQRKKKELDYEETHKLKNMIKGLDDDEIEFLDMVDRTKMEQEKRLLNEEAREIQHFRSKVSAFKEQSFDKKIEEEVTPVISCINNTLSSRMATPHNKVLASIVKKRTAVEKLPSSPIKKSCPEETMNSSNKLNSSCQKNTLITSNSDETSKTSDLAKSNEALNINSKNSCTTKNSVQAKNIMYPSTMQCVGILPGIGSYVSDDSSDSERTSGSDIEDEVFGIRGQKVPKQVKQ